MKPWLPLALLLLTACSPDIIPVHYSRVNSARSAQQPLELSPESPGAFTQFWRFDSPGGYRFDPDEVRFVEGRVHGGARSTPVWLETSHGRPFIGLFHFADKSGDTRPSPARYQLSNDRRTWYYYRDTRWRAAPPDFASASTAAEVQSGISHFHTEVGGGLLFLRVFLPGQPLRDGRESSKPAPPAELQTGLKEIEVRGISPKTDGW